MEKKQVVIVGGGFGGINAARELSDVKGVHVTLIDKRNHHLFQPLLYQVAMAALSPAEIAAPIRSVVRHSGNVDVLLGTVTGVDLNARKVKADFGEVSYDYLIMACGSTHSYFGHDEWEENAPGLKSLEEALEIRRRVLTAFELAEREHDPVVQEELLTFVIVGAGPTGVELAGALSEISHYTMGHDFRNIDPRRTRVYLIEGGPRVLPPFDPRLSEYAQKALEKLDVIVKTNSIVTKVHEHGVVIGNEEIRARTVLWAAGVQPAEINKTLGVATDRGGRVIVERDCSLSAHPEVFVLGDQAAFEAGAGKYLPGVATVAIQQGRYVASLIRQELKGKERKPFQYWDKGSMATIGRALAVAQTRRIRMKGFFAWIGWLLVHIYYLIGFENRMVVLFQWAYNYLTMGRGARIITNRDWHSHTKKNS
ncbi:MAG TPA: NAD(P)/FAD-dependent oxidoreductase [Leptospiraceae bacterium]|nr:NAD(P)/FAD-dependent oxidoreductase [Leptospirales bacterium]HMU84679.1 NAD(P)/FAD-dependent oxidoreductase [Leptospiraceae bacterium]HMW59252.1 NAD(P)/FAD-dependent oxidoreductase [Leptospiraceae bacterium]HMX57694.1 NAD(P)/FAD-dependent oxidoreductase [Leptospiraceae bacterium]HMY45213.1 NAD(P)/FAD-dependent oxidoreductase [Leptospiraceae bacterium]